jgi:hypothetical protein
MEESQESLSQHEEPLGGDGPLFWLLIRISSSQILENMFQTEKAIKDFVPSSKDPQSTFHRVLLSQCQATEAPISLRAASHKGYVNWGDLREEIRRSGQGEGDASPRQWVEGFTANALRHIQPLNGGGYAYRSWWSECGIAFCHRSYLPDCGG